MTHIDSSRPPKAPVADTVAVTVTVIGGDGRMTYAAERLSAAGCPVFLLGCGTDCLPCEEYDGRITLCRTLQKATEHADVLLLPLPATRDGHTVACPRDSHCRVTFHELSELLDRHPTLLLFGGRLPDGLAERFPGRVVDYYDSEALQFQNAYITAEAALMTAMQLTDRTVKGSTVAVIGYGRIGHMLARLLLALGAEVTVCARREESLLRAAAEGCHPLRLGDSTREGDRTERLCHGYSVIFNTVPAHVLTREQWLGMERDTLFVDLASAPFGLSDEYVHEATAAGLRYLRVPSLPGSYAPRNAGSIIAECVLGNLARRQQPSQTRKDVT